MTRKERLLSLLQKKEKLKMQKQANAVGALAEEVAQARDMTERLTLLLEANRSPSHPILPHELRSRSWYGRQVVEQKEFAQNRLEFLSTELSDAQTQLARQQNRENILADKQKIARREGHEERDAKAEGLMPPRAGRRIG